jgi:hypothetical protein
MTEQQFQLEVPAQIKEVAEKTIDQAERGFSAFIEAANKSVSMIPNPTTDMSLKALSHTEQNMKAAFDHAKKLVQAKDLQEAAASSRISESAVRRRNRTVKGTGKQHARTKISRSEGTGR